jgi:Predicted permeases
MRQFIPVCLAALFFFVFLLELGDLFTNLWKYLSNGVSVRQILHVLILFIPKCVSWSMPMAVLFAASYTMGNMYARNELTSIFSSGYSLYLLVIPLLVFGFLLSVGMFFFEDRVVIHSLSEKNNLNRKLLNQSESLSNTNIVVLSSSGDVIYTADYYENKEKKLFSLMVIKRGADRLPAFILQSPVARWTGDHWIPDDYVLYSIGSSNEVSVSTDKIPFTLNEPPETFMRNVTTVDELSANEAKLYIANIRKTGLPYAEQLSNYYKRFSFPFTIFIVLFFSISLGGRFKKNIMLMSLLLSLSVAVMYYVTQMVTMLFAKWEYVSPFAGAWFPVLLFIAASSVILRYART